MNWDTFLKSLESEGGKLIVLIAMLVFLTGVALALMLTGHTPQEAGRELLTGAFSSLLGILYGYLRGNSPRPS